MADSMKDKVQEAGHKISEAATKVGHKIAESAEQAADTVKEKLHQAGDKVNELTQKAGHKVQELAPATGPSEGECCGGTPCSTAIREHMVVVGSCGNQLGVVDHLEGNYIKLTKNDSPDGQHHLIPMGWVERVDEQVHLRKNCGEAKREWQTA